MCKDCKNPNCPKCGTTHSISECVKEWHDVRDELPSLGRYNVKKDFLLNDIDGHLWLGFYNHQSSCWQDFYDNIINVQIIAWQ